MTKVYHLYRCSNSRKIHDSMKGMNVIEEKVWEQFEPAVASLGFSRSFADQVLAALRESHEKSKAATRRQIEEYRQALKKLEAKEDRIYQDHVSGLLDEMGYKRQFKRVREERDHFTTLMAQANEAVSDAFNETAESLIELAMSAKELWKSASPQQKLDYLKVICSNQKLNGVTVEYEMKKPFRILSQMAQKSEWRARLGSNQRPSASEARPDPLS